MDGSDGLKEGIEIKSIGRTAASRPEGQRRPCQHCHGPAGAAYEISHLADGRDRTGKQLIVSRVEAFGFLSGLLVGWLMRRGTLGAVPLEVVALPGDLIGWWGVRRSTLSEGRSADSSYSPGRGIS
ncbi:MAG: hypothetical protein ACT4OM_08625 [Actinomycetota bacterium]